MSFIFKKLSFTDSWLKINKDLMIRVEKYFIRLNSNSQIKFLDNYDNNDLKYKLYEFPYSEFFIMTQYTTTCNWIIENKKIDSTIILKEYIKDIDEVDTNGYVHPYFIEEVLWKKQLILQWFKNCNLDVNDYYENSVYNNWRDKDNKKHSIVNIN